MTYNPLFWNGDAVVRLSNEQAATVRAKKRETWREFHGFGAGEARFANGTDAFWTLVSAMGDRLTERGENFVVVDEDDEVVFCGHIAGHRNSNRGIVLAG